MQIEFDPAKDAANLTKHGVSLAVAGQLDWENALIWTDTRHHYGEPRQVALGLIDDRVSRCICGSWRCASHHQLSQSQLPRGQILC